MGGMEEGGAGGIGWSMEEGGVDGGVGIGVRAGLLVRC